MGKLVVTEFVSLDGVMEDPGGAEQTANGGWTFKFERGEEGDKFKVDELVASDVQLLGRVTYDGFAKAWPTIEAGDFGVKMNTMPKVVVSTTLENPAWENTTVLDGDLAAGVVKLKEQYAGDILVAGSAQLVQSLLALDLVDELHLMIFPIILGSGKRLFGDGEIPATFTLVASEQMGSVVTLTLGKPNQALRGA